MQSNAWINGQRRWVGPPSRSSQAAAQFIHNTTRNQQAGTADISWQYGMANTEVPPPQNSNLKHPNGAYSNMQPSHWQNSAAPRQAASSQRTAQEKNYLLKQLLSDNQQLSTVNVQNGNPNMVTMHPQQNMPAHWNQPAREQSMRTHDGNVVSNKNMFGILNGQSTQPVSTYTTTATSRPREQVTYTGTLVPAADRQSASNNNPRQNVPQRHFFPPSYSQAVSQSFRNNSVTTNSSANGQNLLVSSTNMKTQQYSTHNNWGEVTSSVNSSSHYRQYETSLFLSRTNEAPLNPAVDTQLEMRQKISMIEDYLREPNTAGSDGRSPLFTSSPYGQQQFGSEVRTMASNQHMQPVTSTVPKTYNSNASQSLPLNSGQYLPVTSMQQSVNVPPQQRSVPNIFHISASQDGGRIRRKTFVENRNMVGSLSDASQLPEGILPQRMETQSSVANYHERLEMHLSAKSIDSSIHSSPGRTRAVAVVQPLSQESYQVVSRKTGPDMISQSHGGTATDEYLSNPDKLSISPNVKQIGPGVAPHLYTENQMWSSKSAMTPSAASTDGPCVSFANSARTQDLSQKPLCTDNTGSELAIDMQVDQRVASTAQQTVTCSIIIESGDDDESETTTDPKEVLELSAVPTHPWTFVMLNKLVQGDRTLQMKLNDSDMCSPVNKLIDIFWHGDIKNMLRIKSNPGWYREYLTEVEHFCSKHDTPDSVILSQVKKSFRKHLQSYCVLKHKEVFSEHPYKSSWLNINEQLDDIDKDFGFPWSLRRHLHTVESDNQSDLVDGDDIPAEIVREVLEKMSSSTELESAVISAEKQDSTVKATSAQTASPDTGESDDSSDVYSFEINVLPPQEAKIVFDQVQSTQRMDTDKQPESAMDSYATIELPKIIDITSLSDANLENEPFCPLEEVCCIERLRETFCGSNSAFKCQCKDNQSLEDVTEKTHVKEDVAEQKKERSDSKVHRATKGGNQAKGEENDDYRVMSLGWPELHTELYHTIDLSDDDNEPHSYSDEEPLNVSQRSTSQLPDLENYFAINNESEPEVDCAQDLSPFTENSQSCTSVNSEEDTENLYFGQCEVSNPMSDLEENCDQLISSNVVESELESEEDQTDISAAWSYKQETVRKRKRSHDGFFSVFKKSKKFRNADSQHVLEGASTYEKVVDDEPSASKVQTVELVLFGSTTQDKSALIGGTKSHVSPLKAVCAALRPPKVLTVNLSPKKRKSKKSIVTWEYSVKHLYKKWKISFSPNQLRHGRKLKSKKSSGKSLKRVRSASTEEPLVSSDMRMMDGKTKPCLTLKRRWSLSNELTCGEEKTEKHTVTLDQPADQEAEMPQQDIDVLKFSVLPNSFSFRDGSNETKETNDPVSDVPDFLEGKDESHNKTVLKAKGTWYSIPEKKCSSPPAARTSSLFQAFQKKYKEMTETTVNE